MVTRLWVLTDLGDWRVYDNCEPWQIEEDHLSRIQCAYHTYFAIPPYDVCVLGESLAIGIEWTSLGCLGILPYLYGQICEWPWHVSG